METGNFAQAFGIDIGRRFFFQMIESRYNRVAHTRTTRVGTVNFRPWAIIGGIRFGVGIDWYEPIQLRNGLHITRQRRRFGLAFIIFVKRRLQVTAVGRHHIVHFATLGHTAWMVGRIFARRIFQRVTPNL